MINFSFCSFLVIYAKLCLVTLWRAFIFVYVCVKTKRVGACDATRNLRSCKKSKQIKKIRNPNSRVRYSEDLRRIVVMAEELHELLCGKASKKSDSKQSSLPQDILKSIRKEMAVLESTLKRPSMLESIFNALNTVTPSSIEAERSFSAAGLFVTKLRTSLKDDTVDTLCFLRSHLLKNDTEWVIIGQKTAIKVTKN